jgi:predicted DNA-binding protein with PD1-like motif
MRVLPTRLPPDTDLRLALDQLLLVQDEQAGCVISGIGSLSVACLRLAGREEVTTLVGDLEILSLAGFLSPDGAHLHISVADADGRVIGGHLCRGSLVRTTAELLVGLLAEWSFRRELDRCTGARELSIRPRERPSRQSLEATNGKSQSETGN